MVADRGHRSAPHTADTIVEAWGPDLASCLSEAAQGLVDEFALVPDLHEAVDRSFRVSAPDGDRLVAAVLEEVIFVVDAEGLVPGAVTVETADETECRGTMRVVPISSAMQIGSVPKSVSLSGLQVRSGEAGWSCRVVVDI